jgi:hypothetical protein
MNNNTGDREILGVTLVGPDAGVSSRANPTAQLFSVKPAALVDVRDRILGVIRDAYRQPASERLAVIERAVGGGWALSDLADALCAKPLA